MDNNENIYSADFLRNIKYASRGEVPVRLKLTSRHVIPDMRMFGTTMGMPSADLSLFEEEEEGTGSLKKRAKSFSRKSCLKRELSLKCRRRKATPTPSALPPE